jgi:hypothetical protein
LIVPVLLCVAFFTLAERQIMASMQRRFGPHVSGFGGVLQPFWDGLKLGVKEPVLPDSSSSGAFFAAPMIAFVLAQVAWCAILVSDAAFGGLVVMAISSLSVYGIMLAGWASNSKYAFLGCLRSVALMVSYELSLGSALLSLALLTTDATGMKSLSFHTMTGSVASDYDVLGSVGHRGMLLPLFLLFLMMWGVVWIWHHVGALEYDLLLLSVVTVQPDSMEGPTPVSWHTLMLVSVLLDCPFLLFTALLAIPPAHSLLHKFFLPWGLGTHMPVLATLFLVFTLAIGLVFASLASIPFLSGVHVGTGHALLCLVSLFAVHELLVPAPHRMHPTRR